MAPALVCQPLSKVGISLKCVSHTMCFIVFLPQGVGTDFGIFGGITHRDWVGRGAILHISNKVKLVPPG